MPKAWASGSLSDCEESAQPITGRTQRSVIAALGYDCVTTLLGRNVYRGSAVQLRRWPCPPMPGGAKPSHRAGRRRRRAFRILLEQLHSPESLPPKAYSVCRLINQHLLEHPQLLWPMLIPAEGWLGSRKQLRAEWGGKREAAGRLPKPSV